MINKFDLVLVVLAGLMIKALIIGVVFGLEMTFGQRCAVKYPTKSLEWELCIDRLSEGGEP